jgi:hypothetical protein
VHTPRTHKNAHIFLSFRVVRDGQCEPAPTLIPSPSSVGIFHSGNVKFGLRLHGHLDRITHLPWLDADLKFDTLSDT